MPKNPAWTTEEEIYLELNYRCFTKTEQEKFVKEFEKKFGVKRSSNGIRCKAMQLRVKASSNSGMPTIAQVTRMLKLSTNRLKSLVSRNPEKYKCIREGNSLLVPPETYELFVQLYKPLNQEDLSLTVTIEEAAETLCVTRSNVFQFMKFGIVRSIRNGRWSRIYKDDIRKVMFLRERYGKDWIEAIRVQGNLTPAYYAYAENAKNGSRKRYSKVKEKNISENMDTLRSMLFWAFLIVSNKQLETKYKSNVVKLKQYLKIIKITSKKQKDLKANMRFSERLAKAV
jgi:hypothetical protein